jgi:hypothetical protein
MNARVTASRSNRSFQPTDEQAHAADRYASGASLTIEALAGTGKTSTLRHLVHDGPRRRVLYTAFGRKVVADARASFAGRARVSTNHALAFDAIGRRYLEAGRLERRPTARLLVGRYGWTPDTFARLVSPEHGASLVLAAVQSYLQSADDTLGPSHAAACASRRFLSATEAAALTACVTPLAAYVLSEMLDDESDLPVTHDAYLKRYCLMRPSLPYDVVMLDEAQDATPAVLGLLAGQSAQLVLVGDSHQAIYGWRGARNALRDMATEARCSLTQSFRFGPAVAEVANAVLERRCGSSLALRGAPGLRSHVGPLPAPQAILARTNVALVGALVDAVLQGEPRPAVLGGVEELRALLRGVDDLRDGRRPLVPELVDFASYEDLASCADTDAGREYQVLVTLVSQYGTPALRTLLERVRGNEDRPGASLVLSTAHKAKGAEFQSAALLDDFQLPSSGCADLPQDESGNLLYVALTRAREGLDPTRSLAAAHAFASATGSNSWPSDVALDRAPVGLTIVLQARPPAHMLAPSEGRARKLRERSC